MPRYLYRGRHRAPSNTGRNIARTALAGAIAGGPLVAVTPAASAAPNSTWDRVAQCESGGRWNVNTGNGYHGGLQFSPSTWRSFGGGEFAASANQASRAEQIAVAERVLAKQGWGAWPVCSRKAGARGQAATERSAPDKTAKTVRASAKSAAKSGGKSATKSAVKSGGKSTGKSGGKSRKIVVKRGDTLSGIAARHGVRGGWKALAAKNPGLKPNQLRAGQAVSF
ncbi:MAG TPA: transglycosylase family protein [Pseudonocardia sp.]|nr:transglycosylase family protein [Pseudonocardia sp.]